MVETAEKPLVEEPVRTAPAADDPEVDESLVLRTCYMQGLQEGLLRGRITGYRQMYNDLLSLMVIVLVLAFVVSITLRSWDV